MNQCIVSGIDTYVSAVAYDIARLDLINAHTVSDAAKRAG